MRYTYFASAILLAMPVINVQLLSDLHQDYLVEAMPAPLTFHPAADVLVVAGDVGRGPKELSHLKSLASPSRPIVAIFGNHCAVGLCISELELLAQNLSSPKDGFFVLHRSSVTLFGIRFVGATLWTDGHAMPNGVSFEDSFAHCAPRGFALANEVLGVPFSFEASMREHKKDLSYIAGQLTLPFEGPTIVITHHLPSPRSVSPEFINFPAAAAYASNLPGPIFDGCDYWLHGHTHSSVDYAIGACRVVCNPRGHSRIPGQWQNSEFDPQLLIPVKVS